MELYRLNRPRRLKDVKGQPDAVRVLKNALKKNKVAHCWNFIGPSGTGKTTLARILARELGCDPNDFHESNAADFNGINTVREIRSRMGYAGFGKNKVRIYYMDEYHQMTKAAQNAMLKMLEDTPKHVYFFLSTSEPEKVIKAIRSRCTEVRLSPLKVPHLKEIIEQVAKKAKIKIASPQVLGSIANAADGSARSALVGLQKLQGVKSEEAQLSIIEKAEQAVPANMIVRALLDKRTQWRDMARILKDNAEEEPEGLRLRIIGYCNAILVNGAKNDRAADIIDEFQGNLYDSKRAGFTLGCYNLVNGGKK